MKSNHSVSVVIFRITNSSLLLLISESLSEKYAISGNGIIIGKDKVGEITITSINKTLSQLITNIIPIQN